MVFSSITFIFIFLAAVVLLTALCPQRYRNLLLLLASIAFYAWGEWTYTVVFLAATLFDYGAGLLIGRCRERGRNRAAKAAMLASVIGNIALLGVFKYSVLFIDSLKALGTGISLTALALPLGISFYTFQKMSYTIDVYLGKVAVQKNPITFGTYVCLFPQLIAGPIVRYKDIEEQLYSRTVTVTEAADGIRRFIIGLSKKVLLANAAGSIWETVLGSSQRGSLTAWLGAIAYAFQIYYDFSGYSDMAIGLGKMFGFTFPENFRYPYEAASVTDFWRRWHITLSTWFREYVYIPLGGNRRGAAKQIRNMLIVWALTGLWHGAAWNFLLWGLWFFLFLVLEKFVFGKWLGRLPAVFGHLYAMLVVLFGWVLFACDRMRPLGAYLKSMFCGGVQGREVLYILSENAVLLIVMLFGCTHLPAAWAAKLRKKSEACPVAAACARGIFMAVLFMLCIACLIRESYNPFLYSRF